MENEIMYEEAMTPEVDVIEVGSENSETHLGKTMLIGAGVVAATAAVIMLGKKLFIKLKAKKKEQKTTEVDVDPEEEEIIIED